MIKEKVKKTIKKYQLLAKGDKIVVGVSGGPDSVALLHILNALKKEYILKLYVAHMDHMLRPDSGKDKDFVVALAGKLGVPIITISADIKKLAKKGSLEEIARKARLGFLFEACKKFKAEKIALGHNFDDQAETVLMRILRGTGLYGLAGILPIRRFGRYKIIRPLIETKRRQIESFLRRKKIKARIDKTNLEDIHFRNRLRNKLLPLLEKQYNVNIKGVLSSLAESSGYDYDYLEFSAMAKMPVFSGKLNLAKFTKLHPSMQRFILRLNIAKLKGDTRRITFQHIREIEDMILNRPPNSIVHLPGGLKVIKKAKTLEFNRNKT